MTPKSKKLVLGGIGFAVVLGLVGVGLYFTTQTTKKTASVADNRSRASTPDPSIGVARMSFETSATTRYVGDVFPVKVMLNTGGKSISSLSLRLYYTSDGLATPNLEVVDKNSSLAGTQIESNIPALGSGLQTQVNDVYKQVGTTDYYIDFSAITLDTAGYTTPTSASTSGELMATIYFKVNRAATGPIILRSDTANSTVHDKTTSQDILLNIAPPLSFTLNTDAQAPTVSFDIIDFQGNNFESLPDKTSTGSAATLKFTASDLPARPTDTDPTLTYYYYQTGWKTTTEKSIPITLSHGANIIYYKVVDALGNSTAQLSKTISTDLKPKILTASPSTGPGTNGTSPNGTIVTLTGYNFGTTKKTVYICNSSTTCSPAAAATILTWTDNVITVKAPNMTGYWRVDTAVGSDYFAATPFTAQTKLSLAFTLENLTADKGAVPVDIIISQASKYTASFSAVPAIWSVFDGSYIATTPAFPITIVAGNYNISVKDATHLRQKFDTITLYPHIVNSLSKKTIADKLSSGDVNNDNTITTQDIALVLSKYTALSITIADTDTEMKKFDVDRNGVLNLQDIVMILANYKALNNPGDAAL